MVPQTLAAGAALLDRQSLPNAAAASTLPARSFVEVVINSSAVISSSSSGSSNSSAEESDRDVVSPLPAISRSKVPLQSRFCCHC
jgi:hypothetical protein